MVEKSEGGASRAGAQTNAGLGIAMDAAARDLSLAEDARMLLREQARLARLEADQLSEEGALARRSLRVKHASAVMRFAFELLVALVLLAVVAALASAMWSAAHDSGLVIEALSVPPDMKQRGLSGEVIASGLLDKLTRMQDETNSIRPANTYRNNWGDEIKVEIPDTGISIGELNRYLRRWLGHETHITGEIYHTPSGIAVTARSQGAGDTFYGKEADLDGLLQKAAESIYAETQPYRYAAFLSEKGRNAEAVRVLTSLASRATPAERAWALSLLGNLYNFYNRPQQALATLRAGVAADPTNAHAWDNLATGENSLEHLEDARRHTGQALRLYDTGSVAFNPGRVAVIKLQDRSFLANVVGDYRNAVRFDEGIRQLADQNGSQEQAAIDEALQTGLDHDLSHARRLLAGVHPANLNGRLDWWFQTLAVEFLSRDWHAFEQTMAVGKIFRITPPSYHPLLQSIVSRVPNSLLAEAKAEEGDIAGARRLIATTPADCYDCLRMRGKIDVAARNWGGAAFWFSRAVHAGPGLPHAWSDWGEMLLRKGDLNAAAAEFEIAHNKGPYFADPLEMWGEALMAKNRSDLALAKFEEADKYAPNWGRLHLKWGEALWYAGKTDDAQKQFAVASKLDLSAPEKTEFARMKPHD